MDVVAREIARELKTENHCAVYEKALSRVWPMSDKDRKGKIKTFAAEHGLQPAFYRQGPCAIFIKDPGVSSRSAS
jgi:hypothetical protein